MGRTLVAKRLASAVTAIDGVELAYPVEANAVFARLPAAAIADLLDNGAGDPPFYEWSPGVVRWMCSWATSAEAVDEFAGSVAAAVARA